MALRQDLIQPHLCQLFLASLAGSPCGASGDDTKLLHDRATGGCLPREKHMFFSFNFSQQSIPGQNCWGWAYQGVSRYHLLHTHRDTVQLQQIWLYIILLFDIRYYIHIYIRLCQYIYFQPMVFIGWFSCWDRFCQNPNWPHPFMKQVLMAWGIPPHLNCEKTLKGEYLRVCHAGR